VYLSQDAIKRFYDYKRRKNKLLVVYAMEKFYKNLFQLPYIMKSFEIASYHKKSQKTSGTQRSLSAMPLSKGEYKRASYVFVFKGIDNKYPLHNEV